MTQPLMPKATAVWLIENTALTFEQVAEFCQLHALEVQAIADGEVGIGMQGFDPIANGQLSRDEIQDAQPIHQRVWNYKKVTCQSRQIKVGGQNTYPFQSGAISLMQ